MDVVIYIRWSSAEQGKGSSLERQREDCHRHAALKGWNVVAELVDDGVSAFKGRHSSVGQLGAFVSDAEAGVYGSAVVLLTEKLDRLSREQAKKVFAWMLRVAGRQDGTHLTSRRFLPARRFLANSIQARSHAAKCVARLATPSLTITRRSSTQTCTQTRC